MTKMIKHTVKFERIEMRRQYCFGNSSGGGTGC
jgi:hypothetical protein